MGVEGNAAFLSSTALVVREGERAFISGDDVRVDLELDSEDHSASRPREAITIEFLASFLGVTAGGALEEALLQACLVRTTWCGCAWEGNVLPLSEAIEAVVNEHACRNAIAATASEAIWLGADDSLNRLALRMFVSRFSDGVRLASYGALAGGRSIVVMGDAPREAAVRWAQLEAGTSWHPMAFDLDRQQITGRLTAPEDVGSLQGGRLSIVGIRGEEQWRSARRTVATHVRGLAAQSNLAALDPFSRVNDISVGVAGVAPDPRLARVKCLAEGVERFVAGDVRRSDLRLSPASELAGAWLHPEDVIAYGPAHRKRLGVTRFDPTTPEWWALGWQLDTGAPIWLPAALVFYPFLQTPAWFHPSAVSSNGVAAHTERDRAIESAWLELVERDAFQRARLRAASAPPAIIDPGSLRDDVAGALSLAAAGGKVLMLHLSSPTGIPVVLVRVDAPDGIAIGMSAARDAATAVTKAAYEAYAQAVRPFRHDVAVSEVRTPGDHAALYRHSTWRAKLEWMYHGSVVALDHISRANGQFNPSACVYAYESQVASAWQVVRVIDPALIPLTFGYDADPDGRADFRRLVRESARNPDVPLEPHPFA